MRHITAHSGKVRIILYCLIFIQHGGNGILGQLVITVQYQCQLTHSLLYAHIDGSVLSAIHLLKESDGESLRLHLVDGVTHIVSGPVVNDNPFKVFARLTAQAVIDTWQKTGRLYIGVMMESIISFCSRQT